MCTLLAWNADSQIAVLSWSLPSYVTQEFHKITCTHDTCASPAILMFFSCHICVGCILVHPSLLLDVSCSHTPIHNHIILFPSNWMLSLSIIAWTLLFHVRPRRACQRHLSWLIIGIICDRALTRHPMSNRLNCLNFKNEGGFLGWCNYDWMYDTVRYELLLSTFTKESMCIS